MPAANDKKAARCPICREPRIEAFRPFCSKRCADIDLSRWLSGSYAIPVADDEDEDGDGHAPEDPGGEVAH
jgi:hypothetical protein